VGLWHYAINRKVVSSNPAEAVGFYFNLPNFSSRIIALGLTQPLRKMSARNLSSIGGGGGIKLGRRKADNFTAISEPII
jgi:hypothetical protein